MVLQSEILFYDDASVEKKKYYLHKATSAVSCIKPKVTIRDDV